MRGEHSTSSPVLAMLKRFVCNADGISLPRVRTVLTIDALSYHKMSCRVRTVFHLMPQTSPLRSFQTERS